MPCGLRVVPLRRSNSFVQVQQWLRMAREKLSLAGLSSPLHEARLLLGHALNCSQAGLARDPARELNSMQLQQLTALLEARAKRYPLQYLLGEWEFYGRSFYVTPDVLIPRPETEILVQMVLERLSDVPRASVLDLGTGSGCIAVSLCCENRELQAVALDISPSALKVAASNASRHACDRVGMVVGDISSLPLRRLPAFDLIVSNPPYASAASETDPEVLHEPAGAVFAGKSGLDTLRLILQKTPILLRPSGYLALEIGFGQALQVVQLAKSEGWRVIESRPDLAGIERCLLLERN